MLKSRLLELLTETHNELRLLHGWVERNELPAPRRRIRAELVASVGELLTHTNDARSKRHFEYFTLIMHRPMNDFDLENVTGIPHSDTSSVTCAMRYYGIIEGTGVRRDVQVRNSQGVLQWHNGEVWRLTDDYEERLRECLQETTTVTDSS